MKKQAWSVDEIAAIKKHFANNLKEGRYPSNTVMKDFIDSSQSEISSTNKGKTSASNETKSKLNVLIIIIFIFVI
nr:unnamed protein product [Callosobruchus analis]